EEISEPGRPEKALAALGRKDELERAKNENEEAEAEAGGQCERGKVHGVGLVNASWGGFRLLDNERGSFGPRQEGPFSFRGFGRRMFGRGRKLSVGRIRRGKFDFVFVTAQI